MDEVLAKHLQDPAFRAEWERTALARAVATAVMRYRSEHGLTQAALAKQLGMAQPNIFRLEDGERNPSSEMLQRLAKGLGLGFVLEMGPSDTASSLTEQASADVVTADGVHTVATILAPTPA